MQDFRAVFDKSIRAFGPRILRSASSGSLTAAIFIVATGLSLLAVWALIAEPLVANVNSLLGLSAQPFESIWVLAVISILMAAGAILQTSLSAELEALFLIHPTMITLAIVAAAFVIGRRNRKLDGSMWARAGDGFGFGFGFAVTVAAVTQVSLIGVPTMKQPIVGLFLMVLVVGLPYFLGSANLLGVDKFGEAKKLAWQARSLGVFLVTYSTLVAIAILILVITFLIRPNFSLSSPPNTPGFFESFSTETLVLATLAAILFVPTILFNTLLFSAGAEVGVWAEIAGLSGFNVPNALEFIGSGETISILGIAGYWALPALLISLLLPALLAGASARKSLGNRLINTSDFVVLAGSAATVLLILSYLGSNAIALTHTDPTTDWQTFGLLAVGAKFTAVLPVFLLATIGIYLSAVYAHEFLHKSFPRLFQAMGVREQVSDRSRWHRATGLLVTAGLMLAALYPVSIASAERIIASTNNPEVITRDFAKRVSNSDLDELLLSFGSAKNPWLPADSLEEARANLGPDFEFTVQNLNKQKWGVGDLDAVSNISWQTPKGTSVLNMGFDYVLETRFNVRQVEFTALPVAPILTLRFSDEATRLLSPELLKVSVNSTAVTAGSFRALPGEYVLVFDGFKLFGSESKPFRPISSSEVVLSFGERINYPAGEFERLSEALQSRVSSCDLDDSWDLDCLDVSVGAIRSEAQAASRPPAQYFDFVDSDYIVDSVTCSSVTGSLIAADEVRLALDCTISASFTREFFRTQSFRECTLSLFGRCFLFETRTRRGTSLAVVPYSGSAEKKYVLDAQLSADEQKLEIKER